MRTTNVQIKNLFGISEIRLDGKSVELAGPKGAGKTSVLDAIRFALTNRSDRDYIVRDGADEGEIIIETDTGLHIDRKARKGKADTVKVRDGSMLQTRPAEFLGRIFTPLQLNPVEFTQMSRQEKNRVILSLIEFDWDMEWIREQFGEIPQGVDYSLHILEVLSQIQAENGTYFQSRQNINRDIRNCTSMIEEIARDIPGDYNAEKWQDYDLGARYRELEAIKDSNRKIERAKEYLDGYTNRIRGLEAEREISITAEKQAISVEREGLTGTIERLKAEIKAAEDKITGLDDRLADRTRAIDAVFGEKLAKLESGNESASEWAAKELVNTDNMESEVKTAEEMKKHLNEYRRMKEKQLVVQKLSEQSEDLTNKIALARELPGEILRTATIPIDGLTVESGIPLINGLPISNLSDGELLELCVDVSVSNPGKLEIVLIDGAERLDSESRERLYMRCKEKGLQLIATRVTDGKELEVIEL